MNIQEMIETHHPAIYSALVIGLVVAVGMYKLAKIILSKQKKDLSFVSEAVAAFSSAFSMYFTLKYWPY